MEILKGIGIALVDFFLFAGQVLFAYCASGKIDCILQFLQDFLTNERVTWQATGKALIDVVMVGGGFVALLWIYERLLWNIPKLKLSKQWTEHFLEHFEKVIDCAVAVVALVAMYNGLTGDVASGAAGDSSTVTSVMDLEEFAVSLVVVCAKISIPTYRKMRNLARTHRFEKIKAFASKQYNVWGKDVKRAIQRVLCSALYFVLMWFIVAHVFPDDNKKLSMVLQGKIGIGELVRFALKFLFCILLVGVGFYLLIQEIFLKRVLALSENDMKRTLKTFHWFGNSVMAVIGALTIFYAIQNKANVTGGGSKIAYFMNEKFWAISEAILFGLAVLDFYKVLVGEDETENKQIEDSISDKKCIFIEMKDSTVTESGNQGHFSGEMVTKKQRGRAWKRMRNGRWRR